jgi:hypothetical protein
VQVRAPQPAVHVFLIDVSAPSIESGLLHTTIETIKRHVMALPGDDRKMVGFITYDSALHFYKLKVSSITPLRHFRRVCFSSSLSPLRHFRRSCFFLKHKVC